MNKIISSQFLLIGKSIVNNPSLIVRTLKSDLKIKWIRPEKVSPMHPSKSGDLSEFPKIDKSKYCLDFEMSKELETADDIVKKQFSLEYNGNKFTNYYNQKLSADLVKRHDLDYGSMESKLAILTAKIRYLQQVVQNGPRNGRINTNLKEMIEKRTKYLKYLRRWDYKRFEWILEKLDLEYKPQPEEFIMIARKEGLRQLTRLHCEEIRDKRLKEYRKTLAAQQLPFLKEKLQNLEFIRKEQIELGIDVTVTQNDIDSVRVKYDELQKKQAAEQPDEDPTQKWNIY